MSSETELTENIKARLAEGFHVSNLREFGSAIRSKPFCSKWPTASFVLSCIAYSIAESWDEVPLSVEESNGVREKLRPLMIKILDLMQRNAGAGEMNSTLDELVLKYLTIKS